MKEEMPVGFFVPLRMLTLRTLVYLFFNDKTAFLGIINQLARSLDLVYIKFVREVPEGGLDEATIAPRYDPPASTDYSFTDFSQSVFFPEDNP